MSPILASTAGDTAADGFLSVFFLVMFVFGGALYFFPTIVAFVKKKANKSAILVLNIFLGWTLVGWVVALVWAVSEEQRPVVLQQTIMQPMPPHQGATQTLEVPPSKGLQLGVRTSPRSIILAEKASLMRLKVLSGLSAALICFLLSCGTDPKAAK